ncbi:MAG: MBL fold metallo-hydrolase [Clostridia bacterium]|nr:MBL fold metallo-hydrolase [Clostridia bacterium]
MEAITKNVGQVWWNAANAPWLLQCDPFKVSPHVYYVGNTWVGAYLIDTGDGLALIDTLIFEDAYQLFENIYKLGFNPKDIKNILLTHCHIDHVGGVNPIVSVSGAKVWLSREDEIFADHPFNKKEGIFKVTEFRKPDCYFSDDEPLVLGNIVIRTKLCPGHTPGTTSFFIEDHDENGRKLVVGLHGGVGVNTMSDKYFEENDLDPILRKQFIEGCEAMKSIHVDISIPSHPAHGDLMNRISSDPMDYTPLIDEKEWAHFLDVRAQFAKDLEEK